MPNSIGAMRVIAFMVLFISQALAVETIPYRVVDSVFKSGIIVFEVEVYEDLMSNALPTEDEMKVVAEKLIGHRGDDDRKKLVQFFLEDMRKGEGVYALAEMDGEEPITLRRNPVSLVGLERYSRYLNDDYEIVSPTQ